MDALPIAPAPDASAFSILPLRVLGLRYAAGGVEIIRGVTLEIAAGSPTVILGPNGAGKSVLLRLLHGLLPPSDGRVAWARPEPEARARVVRRVACPWPARRKAVPSGRGAWLRRSSPPPAS